ncbi:7302_t:CDS:2, partial [Cetraspora pellucida]
FVNISSGIVGTLDIPLGQVTSGKKVQVTWTLIAGTEDLTGNTGILSAQDKNTNKIIVIDQVPLAPKTYLWEVNLPAATYVLTLNDTSGVKTSEKFDVIALPSE